MADQLQFRRFNSTQIATITGAQGELIVNTETNRVHVQDGVTAGGFPTASTADITNSTLYFNDDTGGGSIADIYVLTPKSNTSTPTLYADGITLGFVTENTNTGPSTVDYAGLGIKNVKLAGGEDPAAGDIDGRVRMVYDAGNGWFELQREAVFVSGQYFTGSGPANAYILDNFSSSVSPSGLNDQDVYRTTFNADNTGSTTVDFSLILGESAGTSIIPVKLSGGVDDPAAGDITAGQEVTLTYRTSPGIHAELRAQLEIGVNQQWQNVTVIRALDTTYPNTTGRTIEVIITITQGASGSGNVTVGGVPILNHAPPTSGEISSVSFIVPDGTTYEYNNTGGTQSLSLWSELR